MSCVVHIHRAALFALLVVGCYGTVNPAGIDDEDAGVAVDASTDPLPEDASVPPRDAPAASFVCTTADLANMPLGSDPDCWCGYIECVRRESHEVCYPRYQRCETRAHCALLRDDPPAPEGVSDGCWCVYLQCQAREDREYPDDPTSCVLECD